jgi:hypothetical protein
MPPVPDSLPFVDEHGVEIAAAPEVVWETSRLPRRFRLPLPRRSDRHARPHPRDDASARRGEAARRAGVRTAT